MLNGNALFELSEFDHNELFPDTEYVWSALGRLKEYMANLDYPEIDRSLIPDGAPVPRTTIFHDGRFLAGDDIKVEFDDATKGKMKVYKEGVILEGAAVIMAGALLLGEKISIGKGVLIESGAMVKSPTVLGDCTEVRQAAYLRGHCLAGKRCVLGHATEVKHSIFLNDAKAGHFAYLGDSILGNNANLGAGTKFANLRFISGNVTIKLADERIDTGRRKFGAILGDDSQTGCNSVTNPGTVFGRKCMLMPNTTAPSGFQLNKSIIR